MAYEEIYCDECEDFQSHRDDADASGNTEAAEDVTRLWDEHRERDHDI